MKHKRIFLSMLSQQQSWAERYKLEITEHHGDQFATAVLSEYRGKDVQRFIITGSTSADLLRLGHDIGTAVKVMNPRQPTCGQEGGAPIASEPSTLRPEKAGLL